jgi:hypothetical protein
MKQDETGTVIVILQISTVVYKKSQADHLRPYVLGNIYM